MNVAQQITDHQQTSSNIFSTEVIANVATARGIAFQIAIIAMVLSTSDDEGEDGPYLKQLKALCTAFSTRIGFALSDPIEGDDFKADYAAIRSFAHQAETLPDAAPSLSRAEAMALSDAVRNDVVPAINKIMGALQTEQDMAQQEHVENLEDRASILDEMLTDMQRISRMIGLIAINASIEAARTGGESGKAFTVIAGEVRTLSAESANLITKTRQALQTRN